jgi:hypothetical protein
MMDSERTQTTQPRTQSFYQDGCNTLRMHATHPEETQHVCHALRMTGETQNGLRMQPQQSNDAKDYGLGTHSDLKCVYTTQVACQRTLE